MAEWDCTCRPHSGDRPSTGPVLPEGPVDPSYGIPLPPVIDNGLPGLPPHVSTGPVRPTFPVDPDYGLPTLPTVWPNPPGLDAGVEHPIVLPPLKPGFPIALPPPEVSNDLPGGAVWPPLHDSLPDKLLALVWIVGVGYRWAVLDNTVELPIAPTPEPK